MYANGMSKKDLIKIVFYEEYICFFDKNLKKVLMDIQLYSVPFYFIGIIFCIAVVSTLVPIYVIKKFSPVEMIGGYNE